VELAPGAIDFELDREAFGADRSRVLARIAGERAVAPGCGYALARPGSDAVSFGPAVARSAEAARALARWFAFRHTAEDAYWDLLPENVEAARIARELGFERRRELVRMARPGAPHPAPFRSHNASVFAIAGFEYG
jgi:hypothetical protein